MLPIGAFARAISAERRWLRPLRLRFFDPGRDPVERRLKPVAHQLARPAEQCTRPAAPWGVWRGGRRFKGGGLPLHFPCLYGLARVPPLALSDLPQFALDLGNFPVRTRAVLRSAIARLMLPISVRILSRSFAFAFGPTWSEGSRSIPCSFSVR